MTDKLHINENKNKDYILNLYFIIVFTLVLIFLFILFDILLNQIKTTKEVTIETSKQMAYNVFNRLENDIQTLQITADAIGKNEKFKPNDIKNYIKNTGKQSIFYYLSYVQLDGTAYTAARGNVFLPKTNLNKLECFQKSKKGQPCFIRIPETINKWSTIRNIYTIPIYDKNNKIKAVLSATTKADIYKTILDINNFNGRAFANIINSNGDYVIRSDNENNEDFMNMFSQTYKYSSMNLNKLKEAVQKQKTGIFWTVFNQKLWIVAYTPVSYQDWMLISFVPADIMIVNIIKAISFAVFLMILFNIVIIMILKRINAIQQKAYNSMMKIAFTDEITHAPNKAKFIFEAQKLLAKITPQERYAIILMDINKFKVINEIYGFETANTILFDIYNIINKNLPKQTLLARFYAATYLFIIKYEKEDDINDVVEKIHSDIETYNKENIPVLKAESNSGAIAKLVPLFGIYLINDTTIPINIMCDRVSLAKRALGDNTNKYIYYYEDNLRKQLINEKSIEDEMHKALQEHQFVMYLQPKYDMKTLTVAGSEALVRWIHPTKGFISPGEFIPLFEKNGFVLNLDRYIWEEAFKTVKSWIDRGYKPVPISVNISRLHLSNNDFIQYLHDLLEKYKFEPEYIELEMTESVGFEDYDRFIIVIKELKKLGFSISIDDFGSGYSSLNMLRKIPCDIIKLDRGFINDTTNDERGKVVVQHVLSMAKNLSLKTVSEGIETVDQAQFLTDAGCDIAQGFLYAKPMKVEDFEKVAFIDKKLKIEGLRI